MKIPEIHGINKIRDTNICKLYGIDNMRVEDIALKVELTPTRVWQILYKNRGFVNIDRDWETIKQIHRIKTQIASRPTTKKDVADLEELLRRILDNKPLIDQSQHYDYKEVKIVIDQNTDISSTREAGNRISGHLKV